MSERTILIPFDSDEETVKRKKYGTILYTFSNTYLIKKQCVIACGALIILVMILLVILFFGLASLISAQNIDIEKTKKAFANDIRFPNGTNYTEYVESVRNIIPDDSQRWTDGIVYYTIDSSFNSYSRLLIKNSLSQMSDEIGYRTDGQKCIKFKKRTNEQNYLRFIEDDGCWSNIGMTGGQQEVSIGDGCKWKGIILHEVMHSLGFWHEHTRPDRDQYVTVHRENVEPLNAYNFDKLLFTRTLTPFDLDSILIYDNYAFTLNGKPTITANNGQILLEAYLKPTLTELNRQAIRLLYKCDEAVTVTTIPTITTTSTTIKPTTTTQPITTSQTTTITLTTTPTTITTFPPTTTPTTTEPTSLPTTPSTTTPPITTFPTTTPQTTTPQTTTPPSTTPPTSTPPTTTPQTTTPPTTKPPTTTPTATTPSTTALPITTPTSTTITTPFTTASTTPTTNTPNTSTTYTSTSTMTTITTTTTSTTTPITTTNSVTITSTIKPTTITTTITPTTTTDIPEFVCQSDGYFANPSDCSRFYRCVQSGQGFIRYEFICALGTVWSNLANTCVHGFNDKCPQ